MRLRPVRTTISAREMNVMVAWWKRLIYSLVSAILGAGVCGACAAAEQVVHNAHGHLNAEAVWTAIVFFDVLLQRFDPRSRFRFGHVLIIRKRVRETIGSGGL